MTCRDFNLLDESFKPEAIRYAANYGPKGKPHPTVTVAGVETIRPAVLASCKARPGDHFVASVNNALKRR
ncbi:HdeA/HdeB family chaperone [Sphingomonas hankookensis]|uniref:HdeA/HdeB family chaperone n=1 Tax=Sphingomonas hankookensis TaxID=563996 RepID=UPI001F59B14D